jgi:hypothetical protein
MEHLFSPCTRYRDLLNSQGNLGNPQLPQEVNLNVSTEELLSAERAFTYADLYAMLGNGDTVVWMTPHTAVVRATGTAACRSFYLQNDYRFSFNVDGKDMYALARSPEHLLEICDVIVRLLSASVVHSVILQIGSSLGRSINATSLALLMEHCQSLKVLALKCLVVDENHCRVLGAYSRPGLEIELEHCRFKGVAAEALAEVMERNQGPTKLESCFIDNAVLANGLRGNSRLEKFILCSYDSNNIGVSKRDFLAIADALKENKGLVELDLDTWLFKGNDETWGAICDSLKTHPTLEVLHLSPVYRRPSTVPAVITSRIEALLDMVKINLSIHTIRLYPSLYTEHELFRRSVVPYLVTNRLRPRLLAIQKTRPIPYRTKVLGRALPAARSDANSFWMLLSGNAEVAFPSTAANLPTPATAAATSTSNVVAATTTLSPTTGAASTISISVIDSDTTPNVGEKRKALP